MKINMHSSLGGPPTGRMHQTPTMTQRSGLIQLYLGYFKYKEAITNPPVTILGIIITIPQN